MSTEKNRSLEWILLFLLLLLASLSRHSSLKTLKTLGEKMDRIEMLIGETEVSVVDE